MTEQEEKLLDERMWSFVDTIRHLSGLANVNTINERDSIYRALERIKTKLSNTKANQLMYNQQNQQSWNFIK